MKKWRFLSNQNSTIVGINDAGIETFTANMNKSLVREIIQNSLDAVIDGGTDPVEVEFIQFDILRESIPDVDELQRAINKCKKSNPIKFERKHPWWRINFIYVIEPE